MASVLEAYNEGLVDEAKVLLELNSKVDYVTIGVLGRQQLIKMLDELHQQPSRRHRATNSHRGGTAPPTAIAAAPSPER